MGPETMNSLVFTNSPGRWLASKIAGRFWPGAYLTRLGGLRRCERPVPVPPGDGWVLCRTRLGGICGTDLNMVYMQQHPGSLLRAFISWPIFLGHENVAQIADTGERVLVDPPIACAARKIEPPCPACRAGKPSTCWNFARGSIPPALGLGYNSFTGGSWSPYFTAHASQIHPLPDGIPDEQAILIDPIACSLHAVLQDLPATSERILVFGSGIIGLGVILALRALDLKVDITATVRHDWQADLATRCGAHRVIFWKQSDIVPAMNGMAQLLGTRNIVLPFKMRFLEGGFDRLYDCTGRAAGVVEGLRLVRSEGKYVIAGTPQLGLMDLTCTWFRELTVLGTTGRAIETLPGETAAQHNYRHVLQLIRQNRLDLSCLKVDLYRQDDYRRALGETRAKRRAGSVKSAFDFR
jgi:L-iditol 2-dehydrogenase